MSYSPEAGHKADGTLAELRAHFARVFAARRAEDAALWAREIESAPVAVAETPGDLCAAPMVGQALDHLRGSDFGATQEYKEIQRLHLHALAVPVDLARQTKDAAHAARNALSAAQHSRAEMREYLDALQAYFTCKSESAQSAADTMGVAPYDALLDLHEPGARLAWITPLFDAVRAVPPGVRSIRPVRRGSRAMDTATVLHIATQKLTHSDPRLHEVEFASHDHAFSVMTPAGPKLAVEATTGDPWRAVLSGLHEAGHCLYEMAFAPADRADQQSRGGVLHEAAALLLEDFLTDHPPVLAHLERELGPWRDTGAGRMIRLDADPLDKARHIILRTDLERAMLAGDLRCADLRDAWAAGCRTLLGEAPADDQACLQDWHWALDLTGYFPVYLLGAMGAAQMWEAILRDADASTAALSQGDLSPVTDWLRTHVFLRGSQASTAQIIQDATGHPLCPDPFLYWCLGAPLATTFVEATQDGKGEQDEWF